MLVAIFAATSASTGSQWQSTLHVPGWTDKPRPSGIREALRTKLWKPRIWHERQSRGALNNEVRKLLGENRLDEAEAALRRSVAVCHQKYGKDHPHTLNAESSLAVTLWRNGRLAESERLQRQTLQKMENTLGHRHADTITVRDNLSISLRQIGKSSEADALNAYNRRGR